MSIRKVMVAVAVGGFAALAVAQEPAGNPAMRMNVITAEIRFATDIEEREPEGVATRFSADQNQIVGWTRIMGARQPIQIVHVWKHGGEEVARVPLDVTSSSFRTWSRKTLRGMTGEWSLEVLGPNGIVIGSKAFAVVPAEDAGDGAKE